MVQNFIRIGTIFAAGAMTVFFAVVVSGCGGSSEDSILQAAADRIASQEMAKFNAIEQTYKNKVVFDSRDQFLAGMSMGWGALVKRYRHFTGYKYKSYIKSNEVDPPYILVIEYDYDFLQTKNVDTDRPNDPKMRQAAAKETEYTGTPCHMIRRYHVNKEGKLVGSPPPPPPMETVFMHGKLPSEDSILPAAKK